MDMLATKVDLATGGLALLAERHLESLPTHSMKENCDSLVEAAHGATAIQPEAELSPIAGPPGLVLHSVEPVSLCTFLISILRMELRRRRFPSLMLQSRLCTCMPEMLLVKRVSRAAVLAKAG